MTPTQRLVAEISLGYLAAAGALLLALLAYSYISDAIEHRRNVRFGQARQAERDAELCRRHTRPDIDVQLEMSRLTARFGSEAREQVRR